MAVEPSAAIFVCTVDFTIPVMKVRSLPIADLRQSSDRLVMKYDDASWHYGGEFPDDLPDKAGATHIAMFVAWAMLNGLGSEYQTVECAEDLVRIKARTITPAEWFVTVCDEKFTDEDLSDEGNAFARAYYGEDGSLKAQGFIADYTQCFPGNSPYYVSDSWSSYDRIAPVISRRFFGWRFARALSRLFWRKGS